MKKLAKNSLAAKKWNFNVYLGLCAMPQFLGYIVSLFTQGCLI
jgi:hypothetical protein